MSAARIISQPSLKMAVPGQIPAVESTPPSDQGGQPVTPILNKGFYNSTCPPASTAIQTRIVGYKKLRQLLQPEHPYFAGKLGYLASFPRYTHAEGSPSPDLLYPKIVAMHPENPYRRLLLNKRAGNRTVNKVQQFVDSVGFDQVRVNKVVFPFQREISRYFAERDSRPGKGRAGVNLAWTIWKRFEGRLYEELPEFEGTAWRLNLHTWSSDKPTEAHYHFHALKPDIVLRDGELVPGPFKVYSPVKEHPFTKRQLLTIKTIWLQLQVNFAKYHAIQGAFSDEVMAVARNEGFGGLLRLMAAAEGTGKGYVNVYVDPETMYLRPGDAPDDRRDFMFAVKYNGRHWSENYAEYTFKHPRAKNPPLWLRGYDNRARVYGWWRAISDWIKPELMADDCREKVSPVDGTDLTYLYRADTTSIQAEIDAGKVGSLEIEKGRPVLSALSPDDAAWLAAVTWPYDPIAQQNARIEAWTATQNLELNEIYEAEQDGSREN